MKYRALWFIEIVLIALLALVLLLPIRDYAMKEYKEYTQHPSPETLKAFHDKSEEESRLRQIIAIPIAVVVLTLAIPIYRIRRRTRMAA
jgi:hypothetical protein